MDIFLIIIGAICLLVGLLGCIVPMLPGPPIAYAGLLLLHLTEQVQFSLTQHIVWIIAVIVVFLLDYFIPLLGVKKFGGTKWGNWGCIIGTLIGMFLFPPWGIILGPFAGAFLGELLGGKNSQEAFKAGWGAFMGFLLGTVIKVVICVWFIYCFIDALVA